MTGMTHDTTMENVATLPRPVQVKRAVDEARRRQAELAKAVGITPSYVCHIFRGAKVPTWPVAKAIADHLGVTMNELWDEVVVMPN